jgi:hypothetical protein
MKFGLDIKNKKAEFDSDAEKLIEKGMDIHEKSWKDKFTTKHDAKKEILELKHHQKLEIDDKKLEQIIKLKELDLEEKKMQEENERRKVKPKIIASSILGVSGTIMMIAGSLMGSASGDSNSGWYAIDCIGLFFFMAIAFIWMPKSK